jgi:hypothetical protein
MSLSVKPMLSRAKFLKLNLPSLGLPTEVELPAAKFYG